MAVTDATYSWFVSVLDTWSQYTGLRTIVKIILRYVTGKSELQRICESGKFGYFETKRVENALYSSKHEDLKRLLVSEDANLHDGLSRIVRIKRIPVDQQSKFLGSMPYFMKKIVSYNILRSKVELCRSESYSEENLKHEELLLKLWSLMQPDNNLSSRYSLQWTDIGFQGKNPATDFRGMGILSLTNMLYLFQKHPKIAAKLFGQSKHPSYGYPFAVVAINLTGTCYELLLCGRLKGFFYCLNKNWYTMEDFQEFFVWLFEDFSEKWLTSEPTNILSFNPFREKYVNDLMKNLLQGQSNLAINYSG